MQSASHTLIPVNESKEQNSRQEVNQRTRNDQATHDKRKKKKQTNKKKTRKVTPLCFSIIINGLGLVQELKERDKILSVKKKVASRSSHCPERTAFIWRLHRAVYSYIFRLK